MLEILTVLDPPTCQADLPSKKFQLDLRSFGVGVPTVGRKVMPWLQCRTEASKITLTVGKGVTDAESQGMCTRGSNTSKGGEGEGEF